MIGAACDWYLKRKIGEDPEEAWDNVLGSYAATFPPEASRKGTFTPIKSRWDTLKEKLFANANSSRAENSLLFSSKSHVSPTLLKFHQDSKAPPVFRPRVPGTFTPDPYDSDSDSDLAEGRKIMGRTPNERKWTASTNYSDATLVNPDGFRRHHGTGGTFRHPPIFTSSLPSSQIEYGDKDAERSPELNLGPHRIEPSKGNDDNWRPVFLKRSDSIKSTSLEVAEVESRDVTTMAPAALHSYDIPGHPTSGHRGSNSTAPLYALPENHSSTPGLVPATPSLIRALNRVSDAQRQAYPESMANGEMNNCAEGVLSENRSYPHPGLSNGQAELGEKDRWRGFWNEVHQKAALP